MPYKTMVVILRGELDTPGLISRIAPLVREFGAHLTGLHAEPLPVAHVAVLAGDMVSIDSAAIEASKQRMVRVREAFIKACAGEGLNHDWRGIETFAGDSASASIATANAADLIVAQQSDPDQFDSVFADLESLLLASGRPVLLLPYIKTPAVDPKKVVIAWKPSKEAGRAVFDALPLLHRANSVEILVINPRASDEHSAEMSAVDIAASLSRHGIAVSVTNLKSSGVPVGDTITNHVADTGVDLLVMGAYSQSPLREMIFGGVTRTMLKTMPIPVLMSH